MNPSISPVLNNARKSLTGCLTMVLETKRVGGFFIMLLCLDVYLLVGVCRDDGSRPDGT